jgi:hypothetical protein
MRTALVALACVCLPAAASAGTREAPSALRLTLSVGLAAAEAADDPLDFDLLGAPEPAAPAADAGALRLRRGMLNLHQGLGIGLLTLTSATVVVGQLSYGDRYGGPATGRYELLHAGLSYTTLGLFAATGLLALLSPDADRAPSAAVDRTTLHKIGLYTAAAGMAAQAGLGILTAGREGRLNQQRLATAHLAIGYLTLAGMAFGVGAIVF